MDQVVAQSLTLFKKLTVRTPEVYVNGNVPQLPILKSTNGVAKPANGLNGIGS
jgi:hypothetical protein